MLRRGIRMPMVASLPFALLAACGGGGGGNGTLADVAPSTLTTAANDVPLAGQFLADCIDTGTAVIEGFVGQTPLASVLPDLATLEEVLMSGDPSDIPVIGGLVPSALDPSVLVPVSVDDVTAMLGSSGIPTTLPVIGNAPITCSTVALPSGELPDPTDALGLVPVFDQGNQLVAVVLATVGQAQGGGLPDVTQVDLPVGTDTLPEPLGSAVSSLLAIGL